MLWRDSSASTVAKPLKVITRAASLRIAESAFYYAATRNAARNLPSTSGHHEAK